MPFHVPVPEGPRRDARPRQRPTGLAVPAQELAPVFRVADPDAMEVTPVELAPLAPPVFATPPRQDAAPLVPPSRPESPWQQRVTPPRHRTPVRALNFDDNVALTSFAHDHINNGGNL